MKWIPFSVIALILAFSNASTYMILMSLFACGVSFAYAVHFDNQLMKILSILGRWYNHQLPEKNQYKD